MPFGPPVVVLSCWGNVVFPMSRLVWVKLGSPSTPLFHHLGKPSSKTNEFSVQVCLKKRKENWNGKKHYCFQNKERTKELRATRLRLFSCLLFSTRLVSVCHFPTPKKEKKERKKNNSNVQEIHTKRPTFIHHLAFCSKQKCYLLEILTHRRSIQGKCQW